MSGSAQIHERTSIDPWFLAELEQIAKDPQASFAGERSFKSVDTCAAEFPARTPYYYSGWERKAAHEVRRGERPSVVILGAGPNRIGQGIEFDYCCVHAAMTVRESGRDAVIVNCNPETVSTDYDTSDRLYFEPLTLEDVLGVIEVEQPEGVIVQFGGQTPLKLAAGLVEAGVPLLGTSVDAIDLAEDRGRFGELLDRLGYQAPPYATACSVAGSAGEGRGGRASRCSCAPPTCSADARWRSSIQARGSPTTSRESCQPRTRERNELQILKINRSQTAATRRPDRPSSWTVSWRTRSRSTSTRCATATRCGSAASCSTSRRPACTPATAPACCRRTRSARRCSSRSAPPRATSRSASASWA